MLVKLQNKEATLTAELIQVAGLRTEIMALQEKKAETSITYHKRTKKAVDFDIGTRVFVQNRQRQPLEPLYSLHAVIIKKKKNYTYKLRWIGPGLDGEADGQESKRFYSARLLKKNTLIKTVVRSRKHKQKK